MRTRISRHLGPALEGGVRPAVAVEDTASRVPELAAEPGRGFESRAFPPPLGRPGEPLVIPPEFSGRDYAIFLLRIAAEVEHSLMAQYLFAAYSLGGPDVPAALEDDVRAWQETILGIAKEEMGHLITVQNLLTVLGAAAPVRPRGLPEQQPVLPVRVQAGADVPGVAGQPTSARRAPRTGRRRGGRDQGPRPRPTPARRSTGSASIFDELIRRFADPAGCPTAPSRRPRWPSRPRWDEWGRGYRGASGATEATEHLPDLPAPELVILPADSRDHGPDRARGRWPSRARAWRPRRTRTTRTSSGSGIYRALKDLGPGVADLVRPVAANPSTGAVEGGDAGDPDTPTTIVHPEARLWAHLFNVRYRKLLVDLSHAFELATDRPTCRPCHRGAG